MSSIDEALERARQKRKQQKREYASAPTLGGDPLPPGLTEVSPVGPSYLGTNSPISPDDPPWYASFGRGMVSGVESAAEFLTGLSPFADLYAFAWDNAGELTGVPKAEGGHGQAMEAAGEAVTLGAPFAPLAAAAAPAIGVSPVIAVLSEMGFSALGGYTADMLDQEGHPLVGIASAMALGAPTTATSRVAQKAASRADEVYKSIRKMTGEASYLTSELGVTRRSLVRASEEAKRRVPMVEEFVEALKRGENINKQFPGSGISTRQIADDMEFGQGGPHWAAMEENISRNSVEFGTQAARRKSKMLRYLAEEWSKLGGDEASNLPEFLARYDDGFRDLKAQERAAWEVVRQGEMPRFDLTSIRRYIGNEVNKLKLSDDKAAIPQVFKDLFDPAVMGDGKTIPTDTDLQTFQAIRSNMLEIMREAKMNPTRQNRRAAQLVKPVLDRMQRSIKAWENVDDTGKSIEYQIARRMTLENNHLYDLDSPVMRILERGGTERNLFTAMRTAKGKRGKRMNPETEARRLVRIANQTPDGLSNLRRMAIEDLFQGIGMNPTAVRTPLKLLKQNAPAYKVVLGDDYDKAIELLELASLATRGKAGEAAQAMTTGSGIAPAHFLFGLATEALSPTPGVGVVKKAMKELQKSGTSKMDLMQLRILVKALEDPKVMRILMEMPTDAAAPAWEIGWKRLLAQASGSSTRQGVRQYLQGEIE